MMKPYPCLTAIIFLMVLFTCCEKSSSSGPKTCNFAFAYGSALTSRQPVTYMAGVSDAGSSISSVSYLDSAGTTTVKMPVLPWKITVNLKVGVTPLISVQSIADVGGQVNISIVVNGLESGTQCSN